MALLARFACGCKRRVEIPAPPVVGCREHDAVARLITLPSGQVRYLTVPLEGAPAPERAETLAGDCEERLPRAP